ncbi:MAG: phosphate acyltransferase PlsX [Planctomycetota bacterium]
MPVALDILGGDHAPGEILEGVAWALEAGFPAEKLLLVGPETCIRASLGRAGIRDLPEVIHTEEVVAASEPPVEALRRKPRASVNLCIQAVRTGKASGMVSFGNTGAAVAAAALGLGLLPGIRRPGIAVILKGVGGPFVLLDAGANPNSKPAHLLQYGVMGAAYARHGLEIPQPRVGLLNIGGEARKGTLMARKAHELLEDSGLDFVGNVEGIDLFSGKAEVLVTDGMVGNMVLKVVEGFSEYLVREIDRTGREAQADMREAFRQLLGAADYAEVGGAILLGLRGVVIIGHGRSEARAVLPALRRALHDSEIGLAEKVTRIGTPDLDQDRETQA